jgi:hypothetical protein
MRYEDMLEHTHSVFRGLCTHLLLNPTDEQLDLAIQRSSFDEMKRQEDEEGYREKPDSAPRFFRSGKSGEWRETLTPEQVRTIIVGHNEQMRRFGYLTPEVMSYM